MTKRPSLADQVGTAENGRVIDSSATTSRHMMQPGERATTPNGLDFTPSEAIMWVNTKDIVNGTWPGNNRQRRNGRIEKRPSLAHSRESSYDNRQVHPRAHSRYLEMLEQHGNDVFVVHSNGAPHLPRIEGGGKFSRDGYCQMVINKSYALGRIDINGGCLKRQVADGRVNPAKLLVDISKAKVCDKDAKTCKHIEAERKARQERNAERMAKLEESHKSQETRQHEESQTMMEAIKQLLAERK